MFSLNEGVINKIIDETLPSFQNVEKNKLNLGFGFIFYSIVRALRPAQTVVIGSKAGFSPVMFGLGLKDNEGTGIGKIECYNTSSDKPYDKGRIYFIDPSYSVDRGDSNHWYGIGFWDNQENVEKLWCEYGLEDYIKHFRMTSSEFLKNADCPEYIDLLYIDGDHSYEGIMHDFSEYEPKLKRNAMIIAHDVDPKVPCLLKNSGGYEVFNDLPDHTYEKLRLPIFPGLAIIRKK